MNVFEWIAVLRLAGYIAILPACGLILWTILHAIKYPPHKMAQAAKENISAQEEVAAEPEPKKEKPPKPPKKPRVKEPKPQKEPKVKEPKPPKEPKAAKLKKEPPAPPEKKTVHICAPEAARILEEIWSPTPTPPEGWMGTPLKTLKEE